MRQLIIKRGHFLRLTISAPTRNTAAKTSQGQNRIGDEIRPIAIPPAKASAIEVSLIPEDPEEETTRKAPEDCPEKALMDVHDRRECVIMQIPPPEKPDQVMIWTQVGISNSTD